MIDISGQTFGRLTAIRSAQYPKWECVCTCGTSKTVDGYKLRNGLTQSCGCLQRERTSRINLIHGNRSNGKSSPEYSSWQSMIRRCYETKNCSYPRYGGRGITICDRWRHSFEKFLSDMGKRPEGTTLDRKENDGNYTPENCRWATPKDQAANRRKRAFIPSDVTKLRNEIRSERAFLPKKLGSKKLRAA